jgi:hypothetical protein
MVLQLTSVSLINISLILPVNIFFLAYLFGLPSSYGAEVVSYFYFLEYFLPLLVPSVFISSISGLSKKVKYIFQRRRTIAAVGTTRI